MNIPHSLLDLARNEPPLLSRYDVAAAGDDKGGDEGGDAATEAALRDASAALEDEAKAQAAAKLQALNRGKKGRTNAQNRKSVLELFKTLDEDGDGSIQVGEIIYDFARNPRNMRIM